MNKIKYGLFGFMIGGIIFSTIGVFANEIIKQAYINDKFPIYVDGQKQDNINSYLIDGHTYLQIKDISTVLNTSVIFNNDKKQIDINTKKGENGLEINTTITTTSAINIQPITSPPPITSLNITEDAQGNKFVEINNLTKWCDSQGFKLAPNDLSQSISKFVIWSKDPKKPVTTNDSTNVYIIDGKFYVKYSFVIDILVPFIEKNK